MSSYIEWVKAKKYSPEQTYFTGLNFDNDTIILTYQYLIKTLNDYALIQRVVKLDNKGSVINQVVDVPVDSGDCSGECINLAVLSPDDQVTSVCIPLSEICKDKGVTWLEDYFNDVGQIPEFNIYGVILLGLGVTLIFRKLKH